MKEDERLLFEEALQPNILVRHSSAPFPLEISHANLEQNMVRWAFSNANMRLLPSTDPTIARLDLLRRVDDLSNSSGSSASYTETLTTTSSEGAAATDKNHTGHERDGRRLLHTHGQHSLDAASTSFFTAADAQRQRQEEASLLPRLTENVEDMSDCFSILFMTADECHPGSEASDLSCPPNNRPDTNSGHSYSAQSVHKIEAIRAQRLLFAARLEAELSIQHEVMEAEFEKCYETADNLHAIDLLNLKEDHEAEVLDLQEERDAALSELQTVATKNEGLENDVRVLDALNFSLEKVVKEKTEEAESFRCQAKEFWQENNELLSENSKYHRAIQARNSHGQDEAQLLADLKYVMAERDALQIENADLARRNDDVYAAYEAVYRENELARRQWDSLIQEKAKDYSWHIKENNSHLALKSDDPKLAEAHATAMAQELYRRETVKVLSLRNELTDVCLTTDAQLRRQEQVINDLSEEVHVLAVALDTSLHENAGLAKNYQELLTAITSNRDASELARGLAGDLKRAFEERALFGLAFLKAEIQVVKSEQQRRAQVCDLRDLLEERNDDLTKLKEQLHEAEEKLSSHEFLLGVKDDEINNTVPVLKDRILEVEQIMKLQAISPDEYQTQVVTDLRCRLERQTQITKWYEHELMRTVNQMEGLKAEWDFYSGGTEHDLQFARNFRDERDVLKVECLALKERFADELLVEPLVVPETMKTNKQIEDEQLASPDQRVIKQFLDTYKALPKWIVEPGCPGYEVLRAEHMEGRFEKEREAIRKSFSVEGQNPEGEEFASFLQGEEEDIFF
jgi:hypothetical protein